MGTTHIRVTRREKKALDGLKRFQRETYSEIIQRLRCENNPKNKSCIKIKHE